MGAQAAMTTRQEMEAEGQRLVGKTALYSVRTRFVGQQSGTPDISFRVTIMAYRVVFGRLRVRIEPVDGEGHWWVEPTSQGMKIDK